MGTTIPNDPVTVNNKSPFSGFIEADNSLKYCWGTWRTFLKSKYPEETLDITRKGTPDATCGGG